MNGRPRFASDMLARSAANVKHRCLLRINVASGYVTVAAAPTVEAEELVALNVKVLPDFRRDYKLTAAQLDMDMVEVLQESFALFKRERSK